jgi:nitrogen regulatory protein PII
MKLIVILVDAARADDVQRLLDARDLPGFTQIPNVLGKGETGRKLGTRAFPGSSNLFFTAVPASKVEPLLAELRHLKNAHGVAEGLAAYAIDTVEVL